MTTLKRLLIGLEVLTGLSSVAGGIALMAGWITMPTELLAGSIFQNYFIPGLILACIVGGTMLFAAYDLKTRTSQPALASMVAGFGLLIWIFTEVAIVGYDSWLQILYFTLAITTLGLAFLVSINK